MSISILIKNGILVSAGSTSKSDILIDEGSIIRIDDCINEGHGQKVIDAKGKYILPGGIDPHVHFHLPVAAGYSSDGFLSGSRAALCGGTTSVIDFVTPLRGESLLAAFEKRKKEADGCLVNYSFHVSPVEWHDSIEEEIRECIKMGVTSFKIYMAYKETIGLSDNDIFNVMKVVGVAGGIVTIHCETGDEIEVLRNKFFNEGHIEPLYHYLSRPAETESKAVARAIEMADKAACPLYIVHVSAEESLSHIRAAHKRGQVVFAETCPQYLLLDDSKYYGSFYQSAPYVMSPPLRTKKDNESLWEAVADGTISVIGTDHCPFTMSQKKAGINDFRKIPGGAGGVEFRSALLYTFGVVAGRLTLERMMELISSGPAKIFGLYPRKGVIMEGADADLVIWNPLPRQKISAKSQHQNCDINIYDDLEVNGRAEYVIINGNVVLESGKMPNHDLSGKYLLRNPVR